MALFERKEVDFSFSDARGRLTQLVHDGVIRGGHYHRKCGEAFFVISGSVEVTLKKADGEETETVLFGKDEFFAIQPFTIHSMYFPEDCLMVQMYNIPVEAEDGTKDIIPEAI